ncbi:EamA family transporter [Solimonas sp. K1W22B-7]|uniref:EamA family transporter n=1 Tax=Solimonas sp. K1W22B-7 TaxID=2303331 RepID=UPI000E331766|nr:EamA family transporter [Solimonas sp. K1W22B-7]AXQ31809.1 EamA family transporter [Solimonas sp. K1W22B-7]
MSRNSSVALALATVYLVWGSTYLAIRVGVRDLPPFLFSGSRFMAAGLLMLLWARSRGHRLPQRWQDWRSIAFAALTMLVAGNGLVTWSEQWVESNQAALIVATSALWIAWFGTFGSRGETVNRLSIVGLAVGFAGVAVLVGGGLQLRAAPPLAYAALLAATVAWGAGSVALRRHPPACSAWVGAALQMMIAGAVMGSIGMASGEAPRWHMTPTAAWMLLYLTVFGSCIAYGAYFWLVQQVTPAVLGTYAYVNPAVAVVLGWAILDERLSPTQWLGTLVILGGVVLVTLASRKPKPASPA